MKDNPILSEPPGGDVLDMLGALAEANGIACKSAQRDPCPPVHFALVVDANPATDALGESFISYICKRKLDNFCDDSELSDSSYFMPEIRRRRGSLLCRSRHPPCAIRVKIGSRPGSHIRRPRAA